MPGRLSSVKAIPRAALPEIVDVTRDQRREEFSPRDCVQLTYLLPGFCRQRGTLITRGRGEVREIVGEIDHKATAQEIVAAVDRSRVGARRRRRRPGAA